MWTTSKLDDWLAHARQVLSPLSEHPSLEAQVLLAHLLGKPRAWLLSHPDFLLTSDQHTVLTGYLERLRDGVPLPYLIGEQEFFGLPFLVTQDILIPRPETELLVERAIAWLADHPGRRQSVDVGTGSGCIAISLACHAPHVCMYAVERSWPALLVARENARRNGVASRVNLAQADLLEGLSGPFELICANLPYIPSNTLSGLPVSRYEPCLALDGGSDGLVLIRRLLTTSSHKIAPGGLILLEIEYRQGIEAERFARIIFPAAKVRVIQDLSGLDRLVEIHLSE